MKKILVMSLSVAIGIGSIYPIWATNNDSAYKEYDTLVNYEQYINSTNEPNEESILKTTQETYLNTGIVYSPTSYMSDKGTSFQVNLTIDPTKTASDFIDVPATEWYYSDVLNVYRQSLMGGITENEFGPTETTTKAMFVTILHRIAGWQSMQVNHTYTDLEAGAWYSDAVQWAIGTGVYSGFPDTRNFNPDEPITREEIALLIYNFAKYIGFDTTLVNSTSNYADTAQISDWTRQAVQWAVGAGILSGKPDNSLDPTGTATRAEIAAIITRFLNHPFFK